MKIIIIILWFLVFTKALLFWLWLWQLKEYHWGRFRAHFETQALKKIISSFWRIKFPKPTKKILALLALGALFTLVFILSVFEVPALKFYCCLLFSIMLTPLFSSLLILFFQVPTNVLKGRILKKAEKKIRSFDNLAVVGITGSYGKTSTKEFLAQILSHKFRVLKTKEHINAEIGIAQTILQDLSRQHQIFIAEIGAYERGKIKQVSLILKPKIAILTGINEQHMSTFGSQKDIIEAKFELIESLAKDGAAVFNGDSKIIQNSKFLKGGASKIQNYNSKLKIIKLCSSKERLDLWAEDIKVTKESICFKAFSRDGDLADFKVNLIGRQNVINILMAAAAAQEFGMSLKEISQVCRDLKPGPGSLKLVKTTRGLHILDATYSANPDGLVSHLEYLKLWQGRKVIVMPCLIELGRASKQVHRAIGGRIAGVCDMAIITTADRFKELKQGALNFGMSEERILFCDSAGQIFQKIANFVSTDDIILLESRAPRDLIQQLGEL